MVAVVAPEWSEWRRCRYLLWSTTGPCRHCLAPDNEPAVAVRDRFGQLFAYADAGPEHRFPDHEDVLGTLLNVAISCPECGFPDVPRTSTLPEPGTTSGGMPIGQT